MFVCAFVMCALYPSVCVCIRSNMLDVFANVRGCVCACVCVCLCVCLCVLCASVFTYVCVAVWLYMCARARIYILALLCVMGVGWRLPMLVCFIGCGMWCLCVWLHVLVRVSVFVLIRIMCTVVRMFASGRQLAWCACLCLCVST